MADFHQNGSVATLHNLTRMPLEMMEGQLRQFAAMRKITLILPSLFSELGRDALSRIVDELSGATYINHVIIGLDQADAEQYRFARQYFSRLPQKHDILWNDGPRLKAIHKKLEDAGLAPNEPGKGRNVWYCIGYALASQNADVVALHDCDITTYSREMLARLVYPVANPAFPYQFCKGYYPRIAKIEAVAFITLVQAATKSLHELLSGCRPGHRLRHRRAGSSSSRTPGRRGRRPLDLAGLAVADLVEVPSFTDRAHLWPCRSG
jgi:hypothetical protein